MRCLAVKLRLMMCAMFRWLTHCALGVSRFAGPGSHVTEATVAGTFASRYSERNKQTGTTLPLDTAAGDQIGQVAERT